MSRRVAWRAPWARDEAGEASARAAADDQAERTARLIKSLRDARVMKGLSLSDVERDTRINRAYIGAIEEARFEALPAPVYARGFVRSYARYLGLDPVEAVEAMPQDLPAPIGLEPMPGLRRTAPPTLPEVNLPVAGAVAAVIALVVAAVLILPRLSGETGVDLPAGGGPVATSTAGNGVGGGTDPSPSVETVPPFEDGETPNFTGVTRAEAQRVLTSLGVTPLIVDTPDASPAGLVFDQSPAPGAALREGDVVTLFVSQGP